ncbi:MAG: SDR family oxidoreductase [Clostridiales bacterium]|nr:SDR family oxidoreductase [Clostridiales bacterium]
MFDFSGRYAVVTGGAKGIGEGIVRRLVADQASGVAILDVINAEALAKELDPSGSKVLPILCNIADRKAVAEAFQKIYASFGRVDFMINNAGIIRDKMFHRMEDDQWDIVIDVNLKGSYNCTKQVIQQMRDQEFGRIIFTSSIAIYGAVGQSNYAASKGALSVLTKTLAREQMGKNITVNCIIPGGVDTDMTRSAGIAGGGPAPGSGPPPGAGSGGGQRRIAQPKDIASLVCYLCTDEAHYVSGACIDINGGSR